ncbi:hypothetical protein [Pseudomonas batumici]|uniref:Uncharacterized protein n=1 Tax=Pseudomonas batumici TaxID=226910 RepID=A0A0C2I5J0_9PSED|nr:hypothetical protein [Pseudomonas batumici]KIH84481.1 hypothetical protein UCMB321_1712 [Pseudomonas batumici]
MPDINSAHRLLNEPIVNVLLPDSPDWDEIGLLPADQANKPLSVEIPPWEDAPTPDEGDTSVLRVYWNTINLVYQKEWKRDEWSGNSPPTADLFFDIEARYITHGVHELRYEVTLFNGNYDPSRPLTVTIDEVPPQLNSNSTLIFDTDHVTEQYLIDNGDKVQAAVPPYGSSAPGDTITWYWTKNPFAVVDADMVATRTLYRGENGQPQPLDFPGDMILRRGDGDFYGLYRLHDRAGNPSPYSTAYPVRVDVQPQPRDLPAPRVSEASGSPGSEQSTLKALDGVSGVTVVIPDEAAFKPGDTRSVQWGVPGTVGSLHVTVAEDAEGLRYKIPSTHIAQHMGKTIPVYYQVVGVPPNGDADSRLQNLTVQAADNWRTIQCTVPAGSASQISLAKVVQSGKAVFSLPRWAFMAVGQLVTIILSGVDASTGSQLDLTVRERLPVTATELGANAATVDVAVAVIQRFAINTALTVKVQVSFDTAASWLDFPSLNSRLVA